MNRAGRKLLGIAKRNSLEVEDLIKTRLLRLFRGTKIKKNYERIAIGNRGHHLVARNLQGSDFILVEIVR
jgi:hypothetical protein